MRRAKRQLDILMRLADDIDLDSFPWPSGRERLDGIFEGADRQAGGDFRDNACVNWKLDIHPYVGGYWLAAQILLNWVLETHYMQDLLVYPVLFLCRHHLELRLKQLVSLSRALRDDWSPPKFSHSLTVLLDELHGTLPSLTGWDVQNQEWKAVRRCVTQLQQLDPKSEVFRYDSNAKGNAILIACRRGSGSKPASVINLRELLSLMSKLSSFLGGVYDALSELQQSRMDYRGA